MENRFTLTNLHQNRYFLGIDNSRVDPRPSVVFSAQISVIIFVVFNLFPKTPHASNWYFHVFDYPKQCILMSLHIGTYKCICYVILYCIVVLYYIPLHCTVCMVLYCSLLCHVALYFCFIAFSHTALYFITLHYSALHCIAMHCVTFYCAVL